MKPDANESRWNYKKEGLWRMQKSRYAANQFQIMDSEQKIVGLSAAKYNSDNK